MFPKHGNRKKREKGQHCLVIMNQMVIKSIECLQGAEKEKAQKRLNEREGSHRSQEKESLGKMA